MTDIEKEKSDSELHEDRGGKLELIAIKEFVDHPEMYKIIDFLNRSLRDYNLMFGLSKNREEGTVNISIYEV